MNSPLPRYEKVKRFIIDRIESGDYAPGDQLPSEQALVSRLKVSRMTVNRALRELTGEGVIVRAAGLGSFVAENRMRGAVAEIKSIRDEVALRGGDWSAKNLASMEMRATRRLSTEMVLPEGARLFYLGILHFADSEPIEYEERWVNPAIAPHILEQDFTEITTTEYLLSVAPLPWVTQNVRAVAASGQEAELLRTAEGAPCLEIYRKTTTSTQVASLARLIYPGDRFELSARFGMKREG